MSRLTGPDESCRVVYVNSGTNAGKASAQGMSAPLYLDSALTTLADVQTTLGAAIVGSTVIVDAYSKLPLILYPDGVDTIWTSINGGPPTPLYARTDDRLDSLGTRATALEAGGAGDALLVHKAGTEIVTGDKTFTGAVSVQAPTAVGHAATKTYVDTANALLVPQTYRLPLNSMITQNRGALPRVVSLIAGTEDETTSGSNATIAADTANYKLGGQGWQMTMAGAVAGRLTVTPVSPASAGLLTVPAAQAVCLWVYLADATKVTSVTATIYQDAGNTVSWSRSNTSTPTQTLVTGWNLLRWAATAGTTTNWGTINRADVFVTTNAATTATVGHLYLECPEKAKILFILDRGYKSFATRGLARMRAAGIPVTWALDITLLGTSTGTLSEVVSEADIAAYAALGDSVSFHGWDGNPTSAYTASQCRQDASKSIKWLQSRGYRGRMWRAAWVQNNAPQSAAINNLVVAQATGSNGASLETWPPINRWNINRWSFYNRTTAQIDTQFALWQATNSLMVVYNHGIDEAGGNDATPTLFDYFMTKVEAGLAAGWVQPVTFEQLWLQSGFQWGDISGGTTVQTFDKGAAVLGQTM